MVVSCEKSIPMDIVAFLNAQMDGKIVFGIYGLPLRRVRGIEIAPEAAAALVPASDAGTASSAQDPTVTALSEVPADAEAMASSPNDAPHLHRFEKNLRRCLATNLGTDQQRLVLERVRFRFLNIVAAQSAVNDERGDDVTEGDHGAECRLSNRYVVVIDVRGRGNELVFRVKVSRLDWEISKMIIPCYTLRKNVHSHSFVKLSFSFPIFLQLLRPFRPFL